MSRIEEALKRASLDRHKAPSAPSEARPRGLEGNLRSYPTESGADLRPVLAATSPKSPAAIRNLGAPRALPPVAEGKLVLGDAPPVAIEQYRRLAATVHELQASHGTKTVMVTSAIPREGKTLTVTNLALTLSESYGRRVLLIDADLRRPSVHELFNLPNGTGLSDGLRSDTGALAVLPVTPLLSVLPAGRPERNPMGALTSQRMEQLLKEAAACFDWVLLDAPPAGMMPDAQLLACLTDGVIFVIAAGTTPYELVERALSDVGRDHIIGTVLNRISEDVVCTSAYYDGYYGASEAR